MSMPTLTDLQNQINFAVARLESALRDKWPSGKPVEFFRKTGQKTPCQGVVKGWRGEYLVIEYNGRPVRVHWSKIVCPWKT